MDNLRSSSIRIFPNNLLYPTWDIILLRSDGSPLGNLCSCLLGLFVLRATLDERRWTSTGNLKCNRWKEKERSWESWYSRIREWRRVRWKWLINGMILYKNKNLILKLFLLIFLKFIAYKGWIINISIEKSHIISI